MAHTVNERHFGFSSRYLVGYFVFVVVVVCLIIFSFKLLRRKVALFELYAPGIFETAYSFTRISLPSDTKPINPLPNARLFETAL